MNNKLIARFVFVILLSCFEPFVVKSSALDLTQAKIIADDSSNIAAVVLKEEIQKRSDRQLPILSAGEAEPSIQLSLNVDNKIGSEGFQIETEGDHVRITADDSAGLLFGAGYLLRQLEMKPGSIVLPKPINITTAPRYPIRGHQIGYRNRANSWDAWTREQMDQYIRELTFFGTNAIENIPFQDETTAPHMKFTRREMNKIMSEICEKYGIQYWVWTPADFDLNDTAKRAAQLDQHEELYRDCPRLDGVFFPGGDPGENHPSLVMPFLKDIAERLHRHHPEAGVWISLQGFNREEADYFYEYMDEHKPEWLAGVVCGPSSPSIPSTRERLAKQYRLRHYPDITHNVRAQYPVAWWDPAFAHTLGREAINPRPVDMQLIHNAFAPYTDGFITYSDGVHDDVNKIVWSALGWDPEMDLRTILIEYARVYFDDAVASEAAADGILALERNWIGPIAENGAIDATMVMWETLAGVSGLTRGEVEPDWRLQQLLLRAYYDTFVRHKFIFESALEDEANTILLSAPDVGANAAMDKALEVLSRQPEDVLVDLRKEIVDLCDALYKSIALQTSVPNHNASGAERGAILDFIDLPLNNKWWLEDEFKKVRALRSEEEKVARLKEIATWENPGPGSFYDDVGNVAKSPHVVRGEGRNTDPTMRRNPNPDVMWWDNGMSRARRSWIDYMDWPIAVRCDALDPDASYTIRLTGNRDSLLRIDGVRVWPTVDGREIGEFKEFAVPKEALADGQLELTWDRPSEPRLNWRQQSRLTEVWLLKN